MAKFYRFRNALARKTLRCRVLAGGCAGCAVGGWALWGAALWGRQPFVWAAPAVLLCITLACALCMRIWLRQARIFGSGARGERETARALEKLPDAYYIAVNARFFHAGRNTELDFVVAGPHGVTVVEAKHHGGRITGEINAARWAQHKGAQARAKYEKSIASPAQQAAVQVRQLSGQLRAGGCPVSVKGLVWFANPAARVALTGRWHGAGEITVLCAAADDLCAALRQKAQEEKPLSPAARAAVMRVLREANKAASVSR